MTESKPRINYLKFFAKLLVSVSILYFCFTSIDLSQLPKFISRANLLLLFLAYVLDMIGNIVCPALITKLALSSQQFSIPLTAIIKINFIVRFYTLFLPSGATAGIRWLKYKKYGDSPDAVALIVFEKLIQIFLLTATVLVFVVIDYELLGASMGTLLICVSVLFLLSVAALAPFFVSSFSIFLERILDFFKSMLPGFIVRIAEHLLNAASKFQSVHYVTVIKIVATAIVGHTFLVMGLYTLSLSLGIGLSIYAIAWIRALALLIMLVPITVANLGVREGSFMACMKLYDVPGYQAMGFGLTLTAFQVLNGLFGASFELHDQFIAKAE